jgi:hypothetical protein
MAYTLPMATTTVVSDKSFRVILNVFESELEFEELIKSWYRNKYEPT